ncbi:MAG TPA: PDZ domain-containing protein, partial [Pyrinomonadaceae bacterium]|nr:PDZ domain-containing protein [Pyrinomonadaceae bacterium]
MKRKTFLAAAAFALLSPFIARAQEAPPAPPARPSQPAPAQAPAPPVAGFAATFFDDGGFLGVHVEEVTRGNAARYNLSGGPRGVGVKDVVKGSPAERAGLRAGDVIVRFDGESVTSVRKLTRLIVETAPEHTARVAFVRNGSEQEVSATLAKRERVMPTFEGGFLPGFDSEDMKLFGERWKDHSEKWQLKGDELRKKLEGLQRANPGGVPFIVGTSRRIGVTTSPLGRQLADYFGVSGGVLVSSVEANSPADKAGLKAGDIITEADGAKIENAGDLVSALSRKESGEVTLTVVRDKKQRTVRVTPERRETEGVYVRPGSFRIEGPVASITLPSVRATASDVYLS